MIKLWEGNVPGLDISISDFVPSITPYLLDNDKPRGAVIVFPGGGYGVKAPHEGEPVALWLNSIGLSAFVLDYRVYPYQHPYPLMDAQRAIRLVRYKSTEWGIDPERIGILGFSAGGHLVSSAGTHYDDGDAFTMDPVDRVSCKPNAMVLCYPVITLKDFTHEGSRDALLGVNPSHDLVELLSNENHVTADTCPTFLWHTADDSAVPVENSIMFASALSQSNVSFALHIFPKGPHGVGLALDRPELAVWTELCTQWLREIGFRD